jgi:hypothetical protein
MNNTVGTIFQTLYDGDAALTRKCLFRSMLVSTTLLWFPKFKSSRLLRKIVVISEQLRESPEWLYGIALSAQTSSAPPLKQRMDGHLLVFVRDLSVVLCWSAVTRTK